MVWPRIILACTKETPGEYLRKFKIQPLSTGETQAISDPSNDINWISKSWGEPAGYAGSGFAWGAYEQSSLALVACTFFLGNTYEYIGIVTEAQHRQKGMGQV